MQFYHIPGPTPGLHPGLRRSKTVPVSRSLICLLGLLAACGTPPPPRVATDPGADRRELAAILESLERGFYSHWGSVESTAEYARITDAQVPLLREMADSNGEHALLALRILARRAPAERFSVSAKAIIYWTVFQRETQFNRWGLITGSGFVPGVYGAEFLALGPGIAPYLQKSLRDTRRAPVFGNGDERTSRIQEHRVCDYAWVLLATLFDRPLAFHADPRLRDPQIHDLDLWIDRRR